MDFYVLLNLIVVAFPLVLSFDRKVAFYRQWPAAFASIALVVLVFGVWDVWMTARGVWSFNPEYAGTLKILGLPPGEWLFFICVPYACIFILACVRGYIKDKALNFPRWGWLASASAFAVAALLFTGKTYTFTVLLSVAIALAGAAWLIPDTLKSRNFWLAMLITYLPFIVANGILTSWPVVLYDDVQNLGIRIGTIPLEDFFFSFSMLLLALGGFDYLQTQFGRRQAKVS
ncbi:MAG: lycopene cyclase domain-containing protein [Clostridia bacterium]